jgi:cell division protein FtsL
MIYIIFTTFIILFIGYVIFTIIKYNKIYDKMITLETKVDDMENEIKRYVNKEFWDKNFI